MKSRRPNLVQLAVAIILAEKFRPAQPPAPQAAPIEPPHIMPLAKWDRMQKEPQK